MKASLSSYTDGLSARVVSQFLCYDYATTMLHRWGQTLESKKKVHSIISHIIVVVEAITRRFEKKDLWLINRKMNHY